MSHMIMRFLLWIGLLAGAAFSFAGLAAPIYPPADMLNHFRPFALAGTTLLLGFALAVRASRLIFASAALVALNVIIAAMPLRYSADLAERSTAGQALASAGARDIKLITFNMAFNDAKAVASLVIDQDPDVVVLQEVGASHANALRASLHERYPYSRVCTAANRCGAAIFSKRPWVAAGHEHRTGETPELIWTQFDDPELGQLRIVGVHLALPFQAGTQSRHVERLIELRRTLTGPVIFAGDFNMTPWSYRQQHLLAATGLRRHATFLRSWPTDRQFRLPRPTFLIDHVLTTPDIKSVSIRIGPWAGSDHLPVIAQVRVPAR